MLEEESCTTPPVHTNETLLELITALSCGPFEGRVGEVDNDFGILECTLVRKVMGRAEKQRLMGQLECVDELLLVWDIYWAAKFESLCRIAAYAPLQDGKDSLLTRQGISVFRSSLSNSLSGVELEIVSSAFPRTYTPRLRDIMILRQVRELVFGRGTTVLDMVSFRLGRDE